MNTKVLSTLEYNTIIRHLEDKANSAPGKKLCRELLPMTNLTDIEAAQQNTADALTRLFKKGSINFGSNADLSFPLKSLEIESTLLASELLAFSAFLNNVNRVKA